MSSAMIGLSRKRSFARALVPTHRTRHLDLDARDESSQVACKLRDRKELDYELMGNIEVTLYDAKISGYPGGYMHCGNGLWWRL